MGRYYNGDIDGKFWFAVQSSDDALFFGGVEKPQEINYYFDKEEDTAKIKKGITKCLKVLGKYKGELDGFFGGKDSYNDKQLSIALEVREEKVKELLKWYARLELGLKIQKRVKDTGSCSFDAEF